MDIEFIIDLMPGKNIQLSHEQGGKVVQFHIVGNELVLNESNTIEGKYDVVTFSQMKTMGDIKRYGIKSNVGSGVYGWHKNEDGNTAVFYRLDVLF